MDGLFIFERANDLIFARYNDQMKRKIYDMGKNQGLFEDGATEDVYLHLDIIQQIFTPLVTSQYAMYCQFDNTFSSIRCNQDLFVFEKFFGFTFIKIGSNSLDFLRSSIQIACNFALRICGPDLGLLKKQVMKRDLYNKVLDSWNKLFLSDHGTRLEVIEPLIINKDLKQTARKVMCNVIDCLLTDPSYQRCHAFLFVRNKFLSQYSSLKTQQLSTVDLVFLQVLYQRMDSGGTLPYFMQGANSSKFSDCIPCIVTVCHLDYEMHLVIVIEMGNPNVVPALCNVLQSTSLIQGVQMQGDLESLKLAYNCLENHVKQSIDVVKKAKYNSDEIEQIQKKIVTTWDVLKKKYQEVFKGTEQDMVCAISIILPAFAASIKDLLLITSSMKNPIVMSSTLLSSLTSMVEDKLMEYGEFLRVKATRNLTISSYLDEFPGLVHFIYVNRSAGKITIPYYDCTSNTKAVHRKLNVWRMIETAQQDLQYGYLASMWRDSAFLFSYTLWFEDINGRQMRPIVNPTLDTAQQGFRTNVLQNQFYQMLIEKCFPKGASRIRCFELYTIHLGVVNNTCVMEHNRRLAATITEIIDI